MAESKKKVKQIKEPEGNRIGQGGNPDRYYSEHPSWNFSSCDKKYWELNCEGVHKIFWDEILPRLQEWETQTWNEILIGAKKQNHSIDVKALSKRASDRLIELHIEAEALLSLRLNGTHRIYGYMNRAVFHILWVDLEHGDNQNCVCRSHKKHT